MTEQYNPDQLPELIEMDIEEARKIKDWAPRKPYLFWVAALPTNTTWYIVPGTEDGGPPTHPPHWKCGKNPPILVPLERIHVLQKRQVLEEYRVSTSRHWTGLLAPSKTSQQKIDRKVKAYVEQGLLRVDSYFDPCLHEVQIFTWAETRTLPEVFPEVERT